MDVGFLTDWPDGRDPLPLARALSVVKAAWLEELWVDGATRNVPKSMIPEPDASTEKTVPVLMTHRDIRNDLGELIESVTSGTGEYAERVEFDEARAAFIAEEHRRLAERRAAAQATS